MAAKKQRQTFDKFKREQALKERRERKQERKEAARLAKAGAISVENVDGEETAEHAPIA